MAGKELYQEAINLLKALIETPSFSREEEHTAQLIADWFNTQGIEVNRKKNNVWAVNQYFNPDLPTILLNSHHDTVKPNQAYTKDPYKAIVEEGKLLGLGSNDAGGCLVSLMATFLHYYAQTNLPYNLVMAATAEEEISGTEGIQLMLPELPVIDFAVVGEPTGMQMAVAEKGLLVIDAYAEGTPGHSAHLQDKDNAIYHALDDMNWVRQFEFPKQSALLGKVKMTVSQVEAGEQHNMVPAICHFVMDVRINEHYTNKEVFDIIDGHTKSRLQARSFRLNSSGISLEHPVVKAGKAIGLSAFGSPTLSDQALLICPSLKMGPGDTTRSHQADEFIYLQEIEEGIELYIKLFDQILTIQHETLG